MKTAQLAEAVSFALGNPTYWYQVFAISGRVGQTAPVLDILMDEDILAWTVDAMRANAERVKQVYQLDNGDYRIVLDSPVGIEIVFTSQINDEQKKLVEEMRREIKTPLEYVREKMNRVRQKDKTQPPDETFKSLAVFVFTGQGYRPAGVLVAGDDGVVSLPSPIYAPSIYESVATSFRGLSRKDAESIFKERDGYAAQVYTMGGLTEIQGPSPEIAGIRYLEELIRDSMFEMQASE